MKRDLFHVTVDNRDGSDDQTSVYLSEEEAEVVRLLAADLPTLSIEADL